MPRIMTQRTIATRGRLPWTTHQDTVSKGQEATMTMCLLCIYELLSSLLGSCFVLLILTSISQLLIGYFLRFYLFLRVWMFCLHVGPNTSMSIQCLWRREEGIGSAGNRVICSDRNWTWHLWKSSLLSLLSVGTEFLFLCKASPKLRRRNARSFLLIVKPYFA